MFKYKFFEITWSIFNENLYKTLYKFEESLFGQIVQYDENIVY